MKLSEMIRAAAEKKYFNSAVILAAGEGTRFNSDTPKQLYSLMGVPVLVRSARAFEASHLIHEIVVVTKAEDVEQCREILKKYGITKATRVIAGGNTRGQSAKLGFDAVNPACSYVAIHDAARCLVTTENIDEVMYSAYRIGAAAAATRAVDTVKKSSTSNIITETVDREHLWQVQTPQIFKADMYRAAAYMAERDGISATDDCALCERLGFSVGLVECGRFNMKVTFKEDIPLAEAIIKYRGETK